MEQHSLSHLTNGKVLDWGRTAEKARGMSESELVFAISDCVETARVGMPQDAGYYMDQASVYRAELNRTTDAAGA